MYMYSCTYVYVQFPAMDIFILVFFIWMAVPGREQINFAFFCFEWQFPAVNKLFLLLLLFTFIFIFIS